MVDQAFVHDVEALRPKSETEQAERPAAPGQQSLYDRIQQEMDYHDIRPNSLQAEAALKKLVDDHVLGNLDIDMAGEALHGEKFRFTGPLSQQLNGMYDYAAQLAETNKSMADQLSRPK